MCKKIAVLGRGKSLSVYPDFSHLFDKIYIVNDFNQEVWMIGLNHFIGKKIVHVVGRQPTNSLTKKLYAKLNMSSIQSNCFLMENFIHEGDFCVKVDCLPDCMRGRGYPTLPWSLILKYTNHKRRELCNLLEHNQKAMIAEFQEKPIPIRCWPTTGLLAIDLALVENQVDELYLFGFDMYDDDYMIKKKRLYQNKNWDKAKMMVYHLDSLKKEFSNVVFRSPQLKNLGADK